MAVFGAVLTVTAGGLLPGAASASTSQIAIVQEVHDAGAPADPQQFVAQVRELGATVVRVIVPWAAIAPAPRSTTKPSFDAVDPNSYRAGAWAPYDAIVRAATQAGLGVDLTIAGGAPRWAEGAGLPAVARNNLAFAWKPSAADYGQFVRAVGTRYDGHFTPSGSVSPLPAVHLWAIFEEPNFGEHLAPEATDGSRVLAAARMYRGLVNAGWRALTATGHRHDTILIGELAARGLSARPTRTHRRGLPGLFGQSKPLVFIRALYCVDSTYRKLRGQAAQRAGCLSSPRGSGSFRDRNPGLFEASGFADHPEPGNHSPVIDGNADSDFATIADFGRLEAALDKVNRAYGSSARYTIYSTEYGYITSPPAPTNYVSPATAAYYSNWAEYLSWKNPRVASYMQYLQDPASSSLFANFTNGLETSSGVPKDAYNAFRLPLYLPATSFPAAKKVEVWGAARPAPFIALDSNSPQTVSIQLNGNTIRTITTSRPGGYFDLRMRFPASGTVRLAYTYPTLDPLLPAGSAGSTVYSRSVTINVTQTTKPHAP
jgi:hypothetical protein